MFDPVDQLDLMSDGRPLRAQQPVSTAVIYRQPDALSALRLSVQVSGLDEKQIYMPLGVDKAQWSRIMSGQAHFPTNKYELFMDLVGNEILLVWLAYRRGKGLLDLEDAKDKTIRHQAGEIAKLRNEIETLIKYGVIKKP
jgi:hypothetical protein